MSFDEPFLKAAHRHCAANREEVAASTNCACFYCQEVYPAQAVEEFLDDGTALCARCPVDSVLGDASGLPVTDAEFLRAMHEYWFERTVSILVAERAIWWATLKRRLGSLFGSRVMS